VSNYALLIEYDGMKFHGIQKQINASTVQDALEGAIRILLKPQHDLRFHVAGRTDTGVHASGMVCNFYSSTKIKDIDLFKYSVNALSGDGVTVLAMRHVPDAFHARFSCTAREYIFKIIYSKDDHPLLKDRAVWVKETIDWDLVYSQLKHLQGEKDYKSLAKQYSIKDKPSKRTFLYAGIEIDPIQNYLIQFRFKADSFLHNMIRILTGTLVDIGTGKIQGRDLGQIIDSLDRTAAGKTLPAHGLYFYKAHYNSFPEIEEMYKSALHRDIRFPEGSAF
jgi:tRNA pseudouridine38-40 synthase